MNLKLSALIGLILIVSGVHLGMADIIISQATEIIYTPLANTDPNYVPAWSETTDKTWHDLIASNLPNQTVTENMQTTPGYFIIRVRSPYPYHEWVQLDNYTCPVVSGKPGKEVDVLADKHSFISIKMKMDTPYTYPDSPFIPDLAIYESMEQGKDLCDHVINETQVPDENGFYTITSNQSWSSYHEAAPDDIQYI